MTSYPWGTGRNSLPACWRWCVYSAHTSATPDIAWTPGESPAVPHTAKSKHQSKLVIISVICIRHCLNTHWVTSSSTQGPINALTNTSDWLISTCMTEAQVITWSTPGGSQAVQHTVQWRPCYQLGSLCQDPAGIQTTRRSPDHCKEVQTEVAWTCLLFIRVGQSHLARHIERRKKTRQTEKEVGRLLQGIDRPGVRQVPEGSGEERKMEETGCEVIRGAPMAPVVKG